MGGVKDVVRNQRSHRSIFWYSQTQGCVWVAGLGGVTMNAQLPIQSARLLKPQSPRMKI